MLVSIALALLAQQSDRLPRADQRVDCGPLVFDVYVSRTAHAFHLVDQVSAWDNACHGQYRRALEEAGELDAEDEALLADFAAVRRKHPWGQGLEQTFYTPLALDDALRAGVKAKRITPEEAKACERALERFAARADRLLESRRDALEHAFDGIDRDAFAAAAKELARFTGVKSVALPTFPIASPDGGNGGGMDGGRLRWEISDEIAPSILLHEATHAFFMQREELLSALAERTPGLNLTLIGEGFAYAVAPGMHPFREGDLLASEVAHDRCGDDRWDGKMGYGMQRMFGLAVRPLLADAFARGQSLEDFLPRMRDAYLAVNEVMMAQEDRRARLYIGGEARAIVHDRMEDSKYQYWMKQFNLASADSFEEARRDGRPGDLLVVLVSGEDRESVPESARDLLPIEWSALRERLKASRTVEAEGAAGTLRVVLLAAPRTAELEELARTSALVHD